LTRASDLPKPRHWHAIMRLRSLVVQVLVRRIKTNNSPRRLLASCLPGTPVGTGRSRSPSISTECRGSP
jgi:hypothetical protein